MLATAPAIGRAEAFRQAMLDVIAEGKPPDYWAPFVVVGEGAAGIGTLPSRASVSASVPTGSVNPAPALIPTPTKPAVLEPAIPTQKKTSAAKARPKAKAVDWKSTVFGR
jgi:hypothetical protein